MMPIPKVFDTITSATKQDLKELELRIIIKLGTIMVGGISLLVLLMKLFKL